jgi:hypothetical protein
MRTVGSRVTLAAITLGALATLLYSIGAPFTGGG